MIKYKCPNCGTEYYPSRKDQRYCNNWCRVRLHNRKAKELRRRTGEFNNHLNKNYRILVKIMGQNSKITLTYEKYKELGLILKYVTGVNLKNKPITYLLYDMAITMVDEKNIIIEKISNNYVPN